MTVHDAVHKSTRLTGQFRRLNANLTQAGVLRCGVGREGDE